MAYESSTLAGMLIPDGSHRSRRHVRRLPGPRLVRRAQGEGWIGRRSHRRGPRDAPVARDAHDDGHVGGRRLSARHRRGRLQVEPRARPAGRPLVRHQPDPGRPVLRQAHAVVRIHHACRSVRGEIRAQVGGRALGARHGGRSLLERRAAGRTRRHARRPRRRRPHDRDPRLGRRRDCLHDGGRHVVGGLHRRAAAGDGGRRTGRRAAVRARRRGRAGRRVAPLRGRPGGPRGPPAAGLRERQLLDPGGARRLVGRQPDADPRRHPVELLLPARAVVPDARPRPVALHPVGPADDRTHGAAPALRRGGLRLRVAARPGRAAAAPAGRHAPAPAEAGRAPTGRTPRHGRHRRGRDLQLQLVDPVGRIDVQLEHVQAAAVAVPVGDGHEAHDQADDCRPRRRGGGDGAQHPKRAGPLVLHERPRVRPAVPAAGVRVVRPEGQPGGFHDGVRRVLRPPAGRRRAALRPGSDHPLSGDRGRGAADRSGALVRRRRGAAVSLQEPRRAGGSGAHACRVEGDRAVDPAAAPAKRGGTGRCAEARGAESRATSSAPARASPSRHRPRPDARTASGGTPRGSTCRADSRSGRSTRARTGPSGSRSATNRCRPDR